MNIFQSSSHFLLTSVGLLLATPGYSEPNSMQDLRLIDQHLLSTRLQGIVDEEIADAEEKSEEEDYEDMLHMDIEQTKDTPPPLPPRQLKYKTIKINNNVTYILLLYYHYDLDHRSPAVKKNQGYAVMCYICIQRMIYFDDYNNIST